MAGRTVGRKSTRSRKILRGASRPAVLNFARAASPRKDASRVDQIAQPERRHALGLRNEPGEYSITATYTVYTGLPPFPGPQSKKQDAKPQKYEVKTPPVKVQVVLEGNRE